MTDTIILLQLVLLLIQLDIYRLQRRWTPPKNRQSRIPAPIEERRRYEVVPAEGNFITSFIKLMALLGGGALY